MGLSCSGDEYNRRADIAFAAVSNTVRVVDDLLRFDRTFPAHVAGFVRFFKQHGSPVSPSAERNSDSHATIYHGSDTKFDMVE
jgi:hypothetical protein